jgi:hypothetical protein
MGVFGWKRNMFTEITGKSVDFWSITNQIETNMTPEIWRAYFRISAVC